MAKRINITDQIKASVNEALQALQRGDNYDSEYQSKINVNTLSIYTGKRFIRVFKSQESFCDFFKSEDPKLWDIITACYTLLDLAYVQTIPIDHVISLNPTLAAEAKQAKLNQTRYSSPAKQVMPSNYALFVKSYRDRYADGTMGDRVYVVMQADLTGSGDYYELNHYTSKREADRGLSRHIEALQLQSIEQLALH